MKKLFVFALSMSAISLSAPAQKLDESKVSVPVKASFAKKYPGQKPKWEKENGQFEAGFKENGKSKSVLFTAEGTMTESEVDIAVNELPAPVLAYVKLHYKGAAIQEGARITKADGTVNYEAEVNKMDVLFDEKGNFLKAVKD